MKLNKLRIQKLIQYVFNDLNPKEIKIIDHHLDKNDHDLEIVELIVDLCLQEGLNRSQLEDFLFESKEYILSPFWEREEEKILDPILFKKEYKFYSFEDFSLIVFSFFQRNKRIGWNIILGLIVILSVVHFKAPPINQFDSTGTSIELAAFTLKCNHTSSTFSIKKNNWAIDFRHNPEICQFSQNSRKCPISPKITKKLKNLNELITSGIDLFIPDIHIDNNCSKRLVNNCYQKGKLIKEDMVLNGKNYFSFSLEDERSFTINKTPAYIIDQVPVYIDYSISKNEIKYPIKWIKPDDKTYYTAQSGFVALDVLDKDRRISSIVLTGE